MNALHLKEEILGILMLNIFEKKFYLYFNAQISKILGVLLLLIMMPIRDGATALI